MKKLVILTQYFPPEMGAPQSRLYETAQGLMALGWDVRVIAAMPNYPTGNIFEEYKDRFKSKDNIDGIEIWRYWLYASNTKNPLPRILSMVSFSFTVLFALFKVRKFKPTYIFTESPPLTLGLSGLAIAKLSGAKHVMNTSDIWPLTAYELGAISRGFTYNQLEKLEHFLYRKSYACTGQSQQIVEHLTKNGSKRVQLYRNGVNTERFDSLRQEIRKENNAKLKIVYAGLLGVAQGILGLCKNINIAELGAELHIYGEGVEKNDIMSFLGENTDRGIFLHHSIKRDEVPTAIMQYDVALIPLIKPIFGAVPSKIYEAMAAGLPIIFTGGGEGVDIINKYGTGWVCEPADYAQIAQKISEVALMDTTALVEIKNNCVAAAQNIFDRSIQIEQLDQFLSKN